MSPTLQRCPACGGTSDRLDYRIGPVPTRSMTVFAAAHAGAAVPPGEIDLMGCPECGTVFNGLFDPSTQRDGAEYEETQDSSPTFRRYAEDLATRLIRRHGLRGGRVVEIGCGKGGFLSTLCAAAGATGTGIDPVADPGRVTADLRDSVRLLPEFYAESHRSIVAEADLVCCRHTLEHLFDPGEILDLLRRHLAGRSTPVFLDVPAGDHVFEVGGCWDIYYEHCMYYGDIAFSRMLAHHGFEVVHSTREFEGQYLCVEARPGDAAPLPVRPPTRELLAPARRSRDLWSRWFRDRAPSRVHLWGSGSRAVGFLGAVETSGRVAGVVDINPRRRGRWMPGFDRAILSPEDLAGDRTEAVLVMNPAYTEEIRGMLKDLGLEVAVLSVDHPPD